MKEAGKTSQIFIWWQFSFKSKRRSLYRSGSYSNLSNSSGLTVLLDSPVLVWQPSGERGPPLAEEASASAGSSRVGPAGGFPMGERPSMSGSVASGAAVGAMVGIGDNSNMNLSVGGGGGETTLRSRFRTYHSPLHVFAESFLERTRQVAMAGVAAQQQQESAVDAARVLQQQV